MNQRSEYLNQGLEKLKEEQTKGYRICLENISKWTKFREDYEHLERKLGTLADKLDYEIMVPFGSVAFMPGKLIHTNEITVLLGDNWFVERSAKQACEIVTRRIAQCDNTLAQFEKERRQFEQWMLSTKRVREEMGGNLLDIVEECDEGDERAWREKHRQNVKNYHRNKSAEGSSLARKGETEEEYWLRLEKDEAENDEICQDVSEESDLLSSEEDETEPEVSSSDDESNEQTLLRKSVHFKEAVPEPLPKSAPSVPTVKIKFTEAKDSPASVSLESSMATTIPDIQSPSDIYKHFSTESEPKVLKSILKPSSACEASENPPATTASSQSDSAVATREVLDQTDNKAFSGVIVEREPQIGSQDLKEINSCSTRRISKFKEQRMKRT